MPSPNSNDKAGVKVLQEELEDPAHLRDEADINRDIAVLEADIAVHQSNFDTELNKVKKASDYLSYTLVHSAKTGSEPNHYIRHLHQNENGFEACDFSDFVTAEVIVLAHTPCCGTSWPRWSEQHQHHQFRTWMEEVARCESESGMVIDDHPKSRQ